MKVHLLWEQEVADVDAKYRLQVSALAESVAGLNIQEEVSRKRRPRKTSAYETLKKVHLAFFLPLVISCTQPPFWQYGRIILC